MELAIILLITTAYIMYWIVFVWCPKDEREIVEMIISLTNFKVISWQCTGEYLTGKDGGGQISLTLREDKGWLPLYCLHVYIHKEHQAYINVSPLSPLRKLWQVANTQVGEGVGRGKRQIS